MNLSAKMNEIVQNIPRISYKTWVIFYCRFYCYFNKHRAPSTWEPLYGRSVCTISRKEDEWAKPSIFWFT